MSGPAEKRVDHAEQETARLRRRTAELANSVAATEEQTSDTLEKVAKNRSPHHAERLRAGADHARQYAAKERGRAARHTVGSGDDDGTDHNIDERAP
jgi:hypothetical protein